MCKVLAITNMKKVKVNKDFLNAVKEQVCASDNHGFGYAVLSETGEIGGERTTSPDKFVPLENYKNKKLYSLDTINKTKNVFGTIDRQSPKSFIAHGRWSTNTVSLDNTHPFVNDQVALIHNGVVQNQGRELDLKTDNDTEILLRYWESDGMSGIERNVTGYYAMAILDKNGYLHLVKDDAAKLCATYSHTIESYIFATTKEIIEDLCASMKWKYEEIETVKNNVYMIMDGNVPISTRIITPKGSGFMSSVAKKALGYDDDFDDNRFAKWRSNYKKETYRSTKPYGESSDAEKANKAALKEISKNIYDATATEEPEPDYRKDEVIDFSGEGEFDEYDGIPNKEYYDSFKDSEETKDLVSELEENSMLNFMSRSHRRHR